MKSKIMVIEDDEDLARLLYTNIKHLGHECQTWTNNFEGLLVEDTWREFTHAIVDMWLTKEGFSHSFPMGFNILAFLKTHFPHIKRIVYTAIPIETLMIDPHSDFSELADKIFLKPTPFTEIAKAL